MAPPGPCDRQQITSCRHILFFLDFIFFDFI